MKRICPKSGDELTPMARGAYKCSVCGGMFVPRMLVELVHEEAASPADSPAAESLDATTGRCPIDRSIMSRAEIELGPERPPIHLERCGSCHGVWFDAGEWSSLAERHLLERIDEFWTVEWRARQRRERDDASHDRRLRETFGPELYDALQEIARKIKGHERRSQALAFIREASDE
ncbi:MAG TPA: zf-TFIIB domain-containing protein [Thermoanaerobaculia bacterium]|nr:zf-TFIIB domain-containing protein [Thermoanaerobaculia bacterium]